MPLPSTLPLPGGLAMPAVGLGTFKIRGQEAADAVSWALAANYRHIDTASIYKASACKQLSAAIAILLACMLMPDKPACLRGAVHCTLPNMPPFTWLPSIPSRMRRRWGQPSAPVASRASRRGLCLVCSLHKCAGSAATARDALPVTELPLRRWAM